MSKILVYGAGPLGSLFAARLQKGGNDVSILARGQRLDDLRQHGVVLVDAQTKVQTITHVNVVEELKPDDAYDLVLVIMRKNYVLDILPILAANRRTPNILFLSNNAAGPDAYVEALGKERVLIGFPNSAGYREGHVVHCLTGTEDDPAFVPFLVDDKVLFTGDTLNLQNGQVHIFYRLFNMDTSTQKNTIKKLAKLENVVLMCTAHTGTTQNYAHTIKGWHNDKH